MEQTATFDRIMDRVCHEVQHTVGTDGKPLRFLRDGNSTFGSIGAVRGEDLIPIRRLRYERIPNGVAFGRLTIIDYSRGSDAASEAVTEVVQFLTAGIRMRDVRVAD